MASVRAVPSGNPAFVVLEVTMPGTDLPAFRHSIAAAALADGRVDLTAEVERLSAEAETRLIAWLQQQEVLARLGGGA